MRSVKVLLIVSGLFPVLGFSQEANYRPGIFFREDWKEIPAEIPVNQDHVNNPDLELRLYGPGSDSLKKSHHDTPPDDPYYVWSGLCAGTWAVTLRHGEHFADMNGFSKIRWRTKQAGLRQLHILLKLADGTWIVSEQADGPSTDWRITEFNPGDLRWYTLDIGSVTEEKPVADPDLSRVDEIGFTDLMPGGESNACSRVDWMEIHARPVER